MITAPNVLQRGHYFFQVSFPIIYFYPKFHFNRITVMGCMRLSSTAPPTTLRLHSLKTVEKKKMNRRKMRNLLNLGMKQHTQGGLSGYSD